MSNIFSQIKVKDVNFSNRIVMAPMVHFGYKNKNGNMEEKLFNTYLNYADKGIGLIISQALLVADKKEIVGDISNWAGIYSNEHIEYLRKISDTYHKYGTKFIAQLNTLNFKFLEKNSNDINRLSKEDLIYLRDCFIKSAKFCQEAGLDGIELHGAHTYFFNMLSSEISNKREDNYGGNLIERLNLVKEIIEAIKSFSKDDFIISYRMGWTENINTDIETAKALEQLGVDILHVSSGIPEDRKLKLGIKQLVANPWETAEKDFAVGTVIKGKVVEVKPFGIFVEIADGIDAFVHSSDYSWVGEETPKFEIGNEVELKITELDLNDKKIKGSLKALRKSPWEHAMEEYKVGTTVEKKIKTVADFGLFIELTKGIDGFIPTQFASKEFIKNIRDKFNEGDVVKAQVVEVNKDTQKIKLSIKKIEIEEEKREEREQIEKYSTSSSEE